MHTKRRKGTWWMPRDFEPKKDALDCDMPRQAVKKRYSRGSPNGETPQGKTLRLRIK